MSRLLLIFMGGKQHCRLSSVHEVVLWFLFVTKFPRGMLVWSEVPDQWNGVVHYTRAEPRTLQTAHSE